MQNIHKFMIKLNLKNIRPAKLVAQVMLRLKFLEALMIMSRSRFCYVINIEITSCTNTPTFVNVNYNM